MKLKSQLPRLIDAVMIDNPYFNHLDFIWSTEVNERINDPIKEMLRKTDGVDWEYSGPNLPQSKDIFNVSTSGSVNISGSGHFNISDSAGDVGGSGNVSGSSGGTGSARHVSGGSGNVSGTVAPSDLDYFENNLGKIIADTMPKPMDREGDAADFERERVLQETLLADSIEFVRSVQKKYGSTLVRPESSTRATGDHWRIEQVVKSPNDAD